MDKNSKEEKEKPIPSTTKWLMRGTAIFFDIISIIPVVNWIVDVVAYLTFGVWFMMHGRNIFSFGKPRRLFGTIITGIVEAIPGVSAIPTWSILIWWLTSGEEMVGKVASQIPGGAEIVSKLIKK